ncbi:DUF6221 family protein [Paenarthrobacter sp. CAP02]|uniref:DUF6221 family protein n=1 Tax=Paenarthrobacter sp. CAP02 TaxID=3158144 RepID=UPI0032DB5B7D
MTLVKFLEARIAEDEAGEARKYRPLEEKLVDLFGPCTIIRPSPYTVMVKSQDGSDRVLLDAVEFREHYTEPAPDQRTLAECAAKRAIIEQCREDHEDSLTRNDDTEELASGVLYALAGVYKDHPDYQQEWAL